MWCTVESSTYDPLAAHWVERSKFGYTMKAEKVSSCREVFWVYVDGGWTITQDSVAPPHLPELTMPILRALEVEFVDAFNAKDAKSAAAVCQETGVMLKHATVVGGNRAGIQDFLQSLMDAGAKDMWCTVESSTYDPLAAHWVERSKFGYTMKAEKVSSCREVFWVYVDGGWTITQDSVAPPHLPELTMPILRALEVKFVDAFNAKDAKAAAALYQESVVMLKDGEVVGGNRKSIEQFWQSLLDAGAQCMWCLVDSSKFDAAEQLWIERSRFGYTQGHKLVVSFWEVLWVHRNGAWSILKVSMGHQASSKESDGSCEESDASPASPISPRRRLLHSASDLSL